jgi:hypothetical protein
MASKEKLISVEDLSPMGDKNGLDALLTIVNKNGFSNLTTIVVKTELPTNERQARAKNYFTSNEIASDVTHARN